MTFSVDKFLANMSLLDGPMSPSRFEVTIIPRPDNNILRSVPTTNGDNRFINFSAYSANIPGISLDSDYLLSKGYGRVNEIPIRTTFGNCDISFYLDEEVQTYTYLFNWVNAVVNNDGLLAEGGENFSAYYNEVYYPETYYADVEITCFSQAERAILSVRLIDCYPTELSGINMDWGNTDSVATATMSLVFKHIKIYRGQSQFIIPRGS